MEPILLGRKTAFVTPSPIPEIVKGIQPLVFFLWLVVSALLVQAQISTMNQCSRTILVDFLFWVELPYASGTIMFGYVVWYLKFFPLWKELSTCKIKCIPKTSNSASHQHITVAMLSPIWATPDYTWPLDPMLKIHGKSKIVISNTFPQSTGWVIFVS